MTSNAMLCTSLSACAQEIYSDQEHSDQVDITADNIVMIDKPQYLYYLTSTFDSDQLNDMFSYLESLHSANK